MAQSRRLLVAGNWKMHGSTEQADAYVQGLSGVPGVSLVVFPPAVLLARMASRLDPGIATAGAQDVHEAASGAHTGDVAAAMVADVGGRWSIIGHSERRDRHGESDVEVAGKLSAALAAGLEPILCVGEDLSAREGGHAEQVVSTQLEAVAEVAGVDALARSVVAYEPIWAIGTGVTATPEQAESMHATIRALLDRIGAPAATMSILYGGSVKPDNAAELFAGENIDGALVGGASLQAESLVAIAQALAEAKNGANTDG